MADRGGAFLNSLAGAVPGEAIISDAARLEEYAASRPPTASDPPALAVRPRSSEEVRSVVAAAAEAGVSLVPVSSGAPHVKGGSAPHSGDVVVDLSGMDRILHFDRRNRVAVIEPGVTFPALEEEAAREGLRPMTPLLPRPNKSVLASYLEREPITVPKYHWDMTDPLLCVEVVFGTSDVFRTGSAAGPGCLEDQWAAGNAQKNPMGPAATDLARLVQGAQGTMGIVTWASVRLELEPCLRRFGIATSDSTAPLLQFASQLARRKLGDELVLLDSTNASCILGENGPGESPGRFLLVYCVSGLPGYLPEEKVAYQERDIAVIAERAGLRPQYGDRAEELGAMLSHPCAGPNWKTRMKGASLDVFFLATAEPAPGLVDAMYEVAGRYGLGERDVGIYIQPVMQGRSFHVEFNIFFDPGDAGAAARVSDAAGEAAGLLAGKGAFFSRPYEPWVDVAYARCPDTVGALRKLKGIFDPGDIMSRGKLCFKGGETPGTR